MRLLLLSTAVLFIGAFWYLSSEETATAGVFPGAVDQRAVESIPATVVPEKVSAISKSADKVDSVDVLLDGLIQRLEREPEDVDGWVLLGKSYHHLGRWDESAAAFDMAKTLGYTGAPPPLDDAAKQKMAPRSRQPNLFASAETRHMYQQLSQFAPSAETGAQVAAAPNGLRIRVSLAPSLRSKIPDDTNVFIFARGADTRESGGSGAPLAAARRVVTDFPVEIELDDSMAMVADRTISSVSSVIVGARVALSGGPVKGPGDPEVLSASLSSSHSDVIELTIVDSPDAGSQ
ncbi:MAG: tetratricopeptide repeat protein [Halioglobus sp.]